MNLSSEHKALFCLLRAGLWEREPDDLSSFPLTDAQWWNVYRMAVRQTVAGIAYRGLHHLPDDLLPGDDLMIRWVAKTDRIERNNRHANAVLRQLMQLMRRRGLHPVLLKGQGVAACYVHPLLRECGDIDLYFSSREEEREAAEEMRRLGCRVERMPDGSHGYCWQGVEIEHHARLFDLHNPMLGKYLAALVGECGFVSLPFGESSLDMAGWTAGESLPGPGGSPASRTGAAEDSVMVSVPSPLLNLLLLDAHLLKHLMGRGVGLRQFCDMARVYHVLRGSYSPERLAAVYRHTGLLKWSVQLHTFLVEHLGQPPVDLPGIGMDSCTSSDLLHIVLDGGNFGQYEASGERIAQVGWKRKMHTACSFWRHRGFSCAVAPRETFWMVARLAMGNAL